MESNAHEVRAELHLSGLRRSRGRRPSPGGAELSSRSTTGLLSLTLVATTSHRVLAGYEELTLCATGGVGAVTTWHDRVHAPAVETTTVTRSQSMRNRCRLGRSRATLRESRGEKKKPFEFANAEVDLTKTEVGLLEVACFFPSFFRFLFCESLLARNCDPSLVARGTRDALKSRAAPIRPKSNGVTDRESPELRSSDETVPCGTGAPLEIQTTVGKNKKKLEGQEGKRRGGCRNRKFSLLRPLKNSGATGGASSKLRGENRQAR